ncbi:GMC family oxidoreductase [Catalinimonas sp. 4WD22]|uniref:GMC family oxidoreductase n=1 Tax=Catalinimonas locisalis TaxID=3133978 RepID=UPI003101661F
MYINAKAKQANTYDAIVIGSGISGGWAAKELTEKGLKTLVLERGRNVEHVKDYPTATKAPWELPHRDRVSPEEIAEHYPKQSRTGYTIRESSKHWFVKDSEHPYQENKRFDWMRGYHVGGRSIMWGRHSYRFSDLDFEANARDGYGVDWPIRYKDIAPWYDYAESFAGIQGQKEGLPQLPDGNFLPPIPMNCLEDHFRKSVKDKLGHVVTIGRTANLTQNHNGRTKCQFRNKCIRGCPYGAYFSSNAATLPAAAATGNLTVRPFSIATSIIYDPEKKRATGVRVVDQETMEDMEFYAKVIFVNASAVASTAILMNSKSDAFPEGMGNSSGELGHNLMDHHFRVGASGTYDGFGDKYYYGRRPTGFYIPRFRNVDKKSEQKDYLRGYGYQGGGSRDNWTAAVSELNFGAGMKDAIVQPGPWSLGMTAFGETLPYHENKMMLDYDNLDKWGQPTVRFDAEFKENEKAMRKDMEVAAAEMLEAAGMKNINTYDAGSWPGLGIHEMGTARMGRDPKTSVLNANNQLHDVPNVYMTDGACMTSAACVNPSLTYMALTARAADHAVNELKKMNV